MACPGGGLPRDRGVHRLVQRHPAAQHPGLPQPGRIRKRPPRHDQQSSLTESSALYVKAGQPQSLELDDYCGKIELSTQQLRNLITLLVSDEFWTITGL
jgi:hypothetical protein